jgi:hypothetical protein
VRTQAQPPSTYRRGKRTHARRRAEQRCGVRLSVAEHDRICAEIRAGRLPEVCRTNPWSSTHSVEVEGRTLHVVFDRAAGVLVTVKTPEMW